MVQRGALGREWRRKAHRTRRPRWTLQDAERERNDRALRPGGEPSPMPGALDLHAPALPPHVVHHRLQLERHTAAAQLGGQGDEQRAVAAQRTKLRRVHGRTACPLFHNRAGARAARVRRVESLRQQARIRARVA